MGYEHPFLEVIKSGHDQSRSSSSVWTLTSCLWSLQHQQLSSTPPAPTLETLGKVRSYSIRTLPIHLLPSPGDHRTCQIGQPLFQFQRDPWHVIYVANAMSAWTTRQLRIRPDGPVTISRIRKWWLGKDFLFLHEISKWSWTIGVKAVHHYHQHTQELL